MTRADAARKVRALLATAAKDSGAFPAERETARRMADKLIAEHGLAGAPKPRAPRPEPTIVVAGVGGFSFQFRSTTNDFGFTFDGTTSTTI